MENQIGTIVMFGLLFMFLYFVMIRPNKKARLQHQQMVESIEPGDEVMTGSGIYGTVRSVGDEDLKLEIAPGIEIRMVKRVIATKVSEHLDDDGDAETDPEQRESENA